MTQTLNTFAAADDVLKIAERTLEMQPNVDAVSVLEIDENYCIGGADEPYLVNVKKGAEIIFNAVRASEHHEDMDGIDPQDWKAIKRTGRSRTDGSIVFDVTRQGCHASTISAREFSVVPA